MMKKMKKSIKDSGILQIKKGPKLTIKQKIDKIRWVLDWKNVGTPTDYKKQYETIKMVVNDCPLQKKY